MDVMNLFESLFRWIHVVAGITSSIAIHSTAGMMPVAASPGSSGAVGP